MLDGPGQMADVDMAALAITACCQAPDGKKLMKRETVALKAAWRRRKRLSALSPAR